MDVGRVGRKHTDSFTSRRIKVPISMEFALPCLNFRCFLSCSVCNLCVLSPSLSVTAQP